MVIYLTQFVTGPKCSQIGNLCLFWAATKNNLKIGKSGPKSIHHKC